MGCSAMSSFKQIDGSKFLGKKNAEECDEMYRRSRTGSGFYKSAKNQIAAELDAQKDAIIDKKFFQVYTLALFSPKAKVEGRREMIKRILIDQLTAKFPGASYTPKLIRDDYEISTIRHDITYYEHFLLYHVAASFTENGFRK